MATTTNQYNPDTVSHPAVTLREKLRELEMKPKEFAVRTGKPEKTISAILNGNSAITPDMAVQFENVLKIPARFWLQRQYNYDEAIARQKRQQAIEEACDWANDFPYSEMAKKGWVISTRKPVEKVEALFHFFGFSTWQAWEKYYLKAELKVAFRISLAHTKSPFALSAWLRQGEIEGQKLKASPFSAKKLKACLPELKTILAEQPDDFFQQAQQLCLCAGVKVVYTPCLAKAPINGATRWLNDTPLLQLSSRCKRNDIFWFSFFHELGHIMLHGKKDIFLENVAYDAFDQQKEKEADEFAAKWLLSFEEEKQITEPENLTDADIRYFAKKFGTHPAIIVGRLQHRKLMRHNEGRDFFEGVDLAAFA